MGARHVPIRQCLVCRTRAPKRTLTRLVVDDHGDVVIDRDGSRCGRGAYLCHNATCRRSPRLVKALRWRLKGTVSEETRTRLERDDES